MARRTHVVVELASYHLVGVGGEREAVDASHGARVEVHHWEREHTFAPAQVFILGKVDLVEPHILAATFLATFCSSLLVARPHTAAHGTPRRVEFDHSNPIEPEGFIKSFCIQRLEHQTRLGGHTSLGGQGVGMAGEFAAVRAVD